MRWRRPTDDTEATEETVSDALAGPVADRPQEPADAATEPGDAWGDEAPPARSGQPSVAGKPDDEHEPSEPGPDPHVPAQLGEIGVGDLQRARRRAVARALAEDLGDAGDVTTAATVPPTLDGSARVVARADGVIAGTDVFVEAFAQVDPRVEVEIRIHDGAEVTRGDVVATVSGRLRSLLTGERVALNFLCHLSGVATQTRRYVDAVAGTSVAVRDTRKTTPGLRLLEKAAVAAGGGVNHRVGLYDALLVKDNHVLAAGSAGDAARRAVERARGRHVQVEVSALDQLDEVLRAGVEDILLDNFTPDEVRVAVRRVAGRARLEASGNITLDTIRTYAQTGVDRIATGALTHSAPWLDVAMDVDPPSTGGGEDADPWFGLHDLLTDAKTEYALEGDADADTGEPGLWASRGDD